MNEHTPGPWRVTPHYDLAGFYCVEEAARTNTGKEEDAANIRLIAAAPDLLEALEMFQKEGNNFCGWHEKYAPAIDLARKAIAKAKGETP